MNRKKKEKMKSVEIYVNTFMSLKIKDVKHAIALANSFPIQTWRGALIRTKDHLYTYLSHSVFAYSYYQKDTVKKEEVLKRIISILMLLSPIQQKTKRRVHIYGELK